MSIEGLNERTQSPPSDLFLRGGLNVGEAVRANVEALTFLGLVSDQVKARETIEADFTRLTEPGFTGRLYVLPGKEQISHAELVAGAEGKRQEGVKPAFVLKQLWVPETEANSYTEQELNQGPATAVARLALFNADIDTGVDPTLHHLDLPFDEQDQESYWCTQLEAIEQDQAAFTEQHPLYTLDAIGPRDFSILALLDRINFVDDVEDQILSRGFMIMPELGRRYVSGVSGVGGSHSIAGQLNFAGISRTPNSGVGVGLSMGQKV